MKLKLSRLLSIVTLGLLVAPVILSQPAGASTQTWVGNQNGNWGDWQSWLNLAVPTATDNVIINNGRGPELSWDLNYTRTGTANTITVGKTAIGTLTLAGGVLTNTDCIVGDTALGTGTVTMTYDTWNNTGTLTVGKMGVGTVTLANGTINTGSCIIGYGNINDGHGTMNITGTGGTLNSSGDVTIGYEGTGVLNLDGGHLSVNNGSGSIYLGRYQSPTYGTGHGTLNFGASTSYVNAASIVGGVGGGNVNFTQTDSYSFGTNLTGNLNVNLGTGTTSFWGNNTYTGTTTNSGTMVILLGQTTLPGVISGTGALSIKGGTTTLGGTNTYTGATAVDGGHLVVNGSLAAASAVNVANGATLSGSGTVNGQVTMNGTLAGTLTLGAVDGSGLVSPGNSPGIMTASSVAIGNGLDFAFEFTRANADPDYSNTMASGNDILHLTGETPFSSSLTSANAIGIYFDTVNGGNTYVGGFFTNLTSAGLSTAVEGANFSYYVKDGDGLVNNSGDVLLNGYYYTILDPAYTVTVSGKLVENAAFASGTVSGSTLEFSVSQVPEPACLTLLALGALALLGRQRHRPAAMP